MRSRLRRVLGLAALVAALAATATRAADVHVDALTGSDANDGLTWGTAKASVSAGLALAVALPGADAVRVAEGRYVGQVVMPAQTSLVGGYESGGASRDVLRRPTILDGGGFGPVVSFGPGTDTSLLDGFVVTGGRTSDPDEGGGITIRASGAGVSRCRVERNVGCRGSGMHVEAQRAPLLVDCIIAENVGTCDASDLGSTGLFVFGQPSPIPAFWTELVIVDNQLRLPAGVPALPERMPGSLTIQDSLVLLDHGIVARNAAGGLLLDGSRLICTNCGIEGNAGWGMVSLCSLRRVTDPAMQHSTFRGNAAGGIVEARGTPPILSLEWHLILEYCVLGEADTVPVRTELDAACLNYWSLCLTQPSMSAAPNGDFCQFRTDDPRFTSGPGGNMYLSQVAAGQALDSPAVDIDSQPASTFGLDVRTTRTDHVPDAGALDWGFHFPLAPSMWTAADFRILRGADPRSLPVHATGLASLPWTDAPGVLSDPALPLLFYSVEWPLNRILVSKDAAAGSVRLSF